jgi:hypothetical protein
MTVLDGGEAQHTLAALVEAGLYAPSNAIINQRLEPLKRVYRDATTKEHSASSYDMGRLIDMLQHVADRFTYVRNKDMQRHFALQEPAELLEFIVTPTIDEWALHKLLPMLSWNASVRGYHDTRAFINAYEEATEGQKGMMLQQVSSNLLFQNQQNTDVNVWLYRRHKEQVEDQGIVFDVQE